MMSRITINLREQSVASHQSDEGTVDLSFSRDQSHSSVIGLKHSRSYSPSSGHPNLPIYFTRPPSARFMSTIWSEQNSGTQTPVHGTSLAPISTDICEAASARVRDRGVV